MAYFQWHPEFSTHVAALDEEHRELLEAAGRLQRMADQGHSAREISELFPELIALEKRHFAREERLMRQQQYPGYAEHKRAHDELTARLVELYDRLRNDEAIGSMALLTFLQDWLIRHMQDPDKLLGDFLAPQAKDQLIA